MATSERDKDLTADLRPEDRQRSVQCIHLIAAPNLADKHVIEGLTPTNHWRVFLELDKDASVAVNMQYIANSKNGKMVITSRDDAHTKFIAKHVEFKPVGSGIDHPVTVQDVIDVIITNGLHKYSFNNIGEGCRHWNLTLFEDLEKQGYIKKGSTDEARETLSYYWRENQPCKDPRPIQKGVFGM